MEIYAANINIYIINYWNKNATGICHCHNANAYRCSRNFVDIGVIGVGVVFFGIVLLVIIMHVFPSRTIFCSCREEVRITVGGGCRCCWRPQRFQSLTELFEFWKFVRFGKTRVYFKVGTCCGIGVRLKLIVCWSTRVMSQFIAAPVLVTVRRR